MSYAAAPPRGAQEPRVSSHPDYALTHGHDALELAAAAGLTGDPWQAGVIVPAMGIRPDRRWSAFEVGVEVPRQNGKGSIGEIRALTGLYLIGERLITWSAHQFDTSLEAFRRLLELTEEADLQREIKRVSRSHGEEGFELRSGQRIRFRTRTKGGGRGFSGDCLILDEAMILPESAMGAMFPTLSARPNPQVWYMGSAVDQEIHEHGIVFSRVRARGHKGDAGLAWFEWSAPFDSPDAVPASAAADPEMWARANPSLGIRISPEYVEKEQRALSARTFAVERLGVGDWPDPSDSGDQVIPDEEWDAVEDRGSKRVGSVCFTFDVSKDSRSAAIAVGGVRADGLEHVEVVEHRAGTAWLLNRLVELHGKHDPQRIRCDEKGPAGEFIAKLDKLGIKVDPIDAQEHAKACVSLISAVEAQSFRHLGQPEVRAALKGAGKRSLVDSWAWSRRSSTADISPLVALTFARREAELMRDSIYEGRGVLVIGN